MAVAPEPPGEEAILPGLVARLEIGSIAASALADPLARALYATVTADVDVDDDAIADYLRRNHLASGGSRPATAVAELFAAPPAAAPSASGSNSAAPPWSG